jgi:hypothetical protein
MMSQLHPALLEFRTELERVGFVVVCHRDHICVRLPLVASVRIRLNAGQLHFEPRFGIVSRGTSLVVTPIVALGAVAAFAAAAATPAVIVAAMAGTFTVLYDIARLVMTEGAMTRLQLLWTTRPPPNEIVAAGGVTAVGAASLGAIPALGGGEALPAAGRVTRAEPVGDRAPSGR